MQKRKLVSMTLVWLLAVGSAVSGLDAQQEGPGFAPEPGEPSRFEAGDGEWSGRQRAAQSGRSPGARGRGPGGLKMALDQLDLSESQRIEIRTVFDQDGDQARAHHDELRALVDDLEQQIETDPLNEESVRAKASAVASLRVEMAVIRARQMGRILEVLTPEQIEQLEQMKQRREARRGQRRGRFGRQPGPRAGF